MKKFFIAYILWSLLFYILLRTPLLISFFDFEYQYNSFTASAGALLISFMGIDAFAVSNTINIPHGTLQILFGCSGLESIALYAAALLSFSNPRILQKLGWLLYGIIILYGLNLLRIYLLAYVREYHIEMFRYVHDYLTQGLFVVFSLLIFLTYLRRIDDAS